jgi:hypothetical protein
MRKFLIAAALAAQMSMGVGVLAAACMKRPECSAPCCEHALPARGSALNACCRVAAPALPALEASAPFAVSPPQGAVIALAPAKVASHLAFARLVSLDKSYCDTSPPKLYLRNSTLLI